MTDTGTDLGRRLDQLAAEVTDDLKLVNPTNAGTDASDPRPGPRLALAGALVAVCLVLAIGGRLVLNIGEDRAPAGGGPTSAGETDGTDGVELPETLRETLAASQPELDLSTARVGPTLDGLAVYSLTTSDRSVTCVVVHQLAGPDDSDATTSWTCSPTYALVIGGAITGGQSSSASGSVTFGVTTDDVIGVTIEGEPALFENNLFLAEGSMDQAARELVYDPDRMAMVDGCESLGIIRDSLTRLRPIDRSDVDQLARSGEQTADGAALAAAADALRPMVDGPGNADAATDDQAGLEVLAATDSCERQRIPGWVLVYVSGEPLPIMDIAPLRDDFPLDSYGTEQRLVDTSSLDSPAEGPNLSAITRVGIGDLPVTVFEWSNFTETQVLFCVHVQIPVHTSTSCGPNPDEPIGFDVAELADVSQADGIDADRIITWRNSDNAAFATATLRGQTYVQRAFGELFVFAFAGDGPVTLISHDSEGEEIRSESFTQN